MARLTEEMVIARAKQSDLTAVKKLNCWGSELVDVSLLRRMPNVEVLSLSVNKISTLVDFAYCSNLRELYVRKNRIADLTELRHLRSLRRLQSLWLDENPCAAKDNYRMTVLRALPGLEKLDNVAVTPEEVHEAMKKGTPIEEHEAYDNYYQQDTYHQYRDRDTRSIESSPDRVPEVDPDFRRCEQNMSEIHCTRNIRTNRNKINKKPELDGSLEKAIFGSRAHRLRGKLTLDPLPVRAHFTVRTSHSKSNCTTSTSYDDSSAFKTKDHLSSANRKSSKYLNKLSGLRKKSSIKAEECQNEMNLPLKLTHENLIKLPSDSNIDRNIREHTKWHTEHFKTALPLGEYSSNVHTKYHSLHSKKLPSNTAAEIPTKVPSKLNDGLVNFEINIVLKYVDSKVQKLRNEILKIGEFVESQFADMSRKIDEISERLKNIRDTKIGHQETERAYFKDSFRIGDRKFSIGTRDLQICFLTLNSRCILEEISNRSSPFAWSDCSDLDANVHLQQQDSQTPRLDTQQQVVGGEVRRRSYSREQDDQLQQTRPQSHYYESSPVLEKSSSCETAPPLTPLPPTISPIAPAIRHSVSTHSIKEYSPPTARSIGAAPTHFSAASHQQNSNRGSSDPISPTYQADYYESVRYQPETMRCPTDAWEQERDKRERHRDNGGPEPSAGPTIASALLSDYRGFVRRPVTRNSNLLSAVLCLVKELDYPSLEVTEMAVRCRMDELANGQ